MEDEEIKRTYNWVVVHLNKLEESFSCRLKEHSYLKQHNWFFQQPRMWPSTKRSSLVEWKDTMPQSRKIIEALL